MADQPITGLPTKTASGVASTDKMLGIDSAEGYQILVRDVAKYIIENCDVSTLAGAVRTPKAAIDLLNSNLVKITRPNTAGVFNSGNVNTLVETGNWVIIDKTNVTGLPSDTGGGWMIVNTERAYHDNSGDIIIQSLYVINSKVTYTRTLSGANWADWIKQPTRAEVDALNSKTTQTSWGTTLSVATSNTIHGILLIGNTYYVQVWMPSTSYINIFVMSPAATYNKSGTGSITFGPTKDGEEFTLTRTGNKTFTFTGTGSNTLSWIGC